MKAESDTRYAVVIEPHHPLAERVADSLRKRGYVVGIAGTHASGAAWAASRTRLDFLVASPPAPEENPEGAYLAEARAGSPDIGVVIMLTERDAQVRDSPRHGVTIGKPFSLLELEVAIDRALASV
jgi:DNA-binding response OmpR family regulator